MKVRTIPMVCAAVAALAPARGAAQLADRPLLVEARVPKPPTLASGSTGDFLIYELHVTNLEGRELRLAKVEVLDATSGAPLLTMADSALWRDMVRPAQGTIAFLDRPRLGGAQRAVVYLRVPLAAGARPAGLVNRVTMNDSTGPRTLTLRRVAVASDVAVIGPPLKGGNWFAANGPGNTSGHRRTVIPLDGVPAISQRFAIDYVRVDTGFRTFSGDRLRNDDYYAESAEAIAVADGIVSAVKDGIPENVPGANSRAVPITLETVGGNHVILDIGGGRYAFYAHLRPGSIRVKVGDRVKRGTTLGLVGNTGNSTEPHLHFHLADANSPLGAEGIPYVHEQLELMGSCKAFGVSCSMHAPDVRRRVMPLENEIVRFPR